MFHLRLLLILALCALMARPGRARAQAVQEDSLMVKEAHRPFDIENEGPRFLAKVAAGTASGAVFTGLSYSFLASQEPPGSNIGDTNTHYWLGLLLISVAIGCSVGFPLGVSSVDPYDSLPMTLLAGVIPGVAGYSVAIANQNMAVTAFSLLYVGPVIGSLYASEKSRKPPQDRRVSLGLAPTLNSGGFAVFTLRF